MSECVVCFSETKQCIPAPHAPYSRYVCHECYRAKRISYYELVEAFSGNLINDAVIGPHIERFKKPTLKYFGHSEEEFLKHVQEFNESHDA